MTEEQYVMGMGFTPAKNLDYKIINRVTEPINYPKMPKMGTVEYGKEMYEFFKKLNDSYGKAHKEGRQNYITIDRY